MRPFLFRPVRTFYVMRKKPLPILSGYFWDDGRGVNGTSLGGRAAPLRPNSNNIGIGTGVFVIQGGKLQAQFPTQNSAIARYDIGISDVIARATITFPPDGTTRVADVIVRYSSNSNYWVARLALDTGTWRMGKVISNAFTFTFGGVDRSQNVTLQPNTPYTIELVAAGDTLQARLYGYEGAQVFSVSGETDLSTATQIALRAQNTVGASGVDFDNWKAEPSPIVADATVSSGVDPAGTSQMRTAMTIVDNNLMFAGAASQKQLARANLAGKLDDLGFFVDSFGHNETYAGWDGVSAMPEPNLNLVNTDLNTNYEAIGSPRPHAYLWRLPWQRTGTYSTSNGSITPNTQAQYNNENRRWLPDKLSDATLWARKMAYHLLTDWQVYFYHVGSEMKGYQGFTTPQTWDWQAYFNWYTAVRTGIRQGATDAGVDPDLVFALGPYPVVAHQGVSDADSVTTDNINDSEGQPVSYALLNNNNGTYGGIGYVNKAPLVAIDEFLRLCQAAGIALPYFATDFGTFNNDNNPTPGISDFDLAYRRFKQHIQWYKERLTARGFGSSKIVLSEWYAKAQYDMSVAGPNFIEESLRAQYQASIKACAYYAMIEEGVNLPMIWSPFGRGDQSTDSANSADPMQWYGGMVKRTVTNNNNHPDSVVADGGTAQPFLEVVEAIHNHFGEGVTLYPLTFSESAEWRGVASATHALITNKSGAEQTLSANNLPPETFTAYQTRLVSLV